MVTTPSEARNDLRGLAQDLTWLDAILSEAVALQRARAGEMLPGVYISEGEVDELLGRPPLTSTVENGVVAPPEAWYGERLVQLAVRCGLTAFDAAVLLIALAQQVDRRYGRLYAYLQDDLTKPFATPGLTLDLLCRGFLAQTQWRSRLQPEAPLLALGLLQLGGDDTQPLRQRPLQMEERVVGFLLGSDAPDAALPGARLHGVPERQVMLVPQAQEAFDKLRGEWCQAPLAAVPLIAGEVASGRRLSAQHLANHAGRPLLTWSASTAVPAWRPLREALLTGAVLCVADCEPLFEESNAAWRETFENTARDSGVPLILTMRTIANLPAEFAGRRTTLLRITGATTKERTAVWLQEARIAGVELKQAQAELLAATYRLDGARIKEAVARAIVLGGGVENASEHLIDASRALSTVTLGTLGREVIPRFGWDDIVLPAEVTVVLREIVERVRHRPLVFGEWGFNAKHAASRNLSILFSGPSGTGKTMSAEVMANDLGLSLYRVDLAAVVSKYIGETEKNLSKIFDDASASGAILFFDEADAMFGKRSEISDSHDRYANLEVSYLLQRMEEYDGIVILASNLRNNMDDAFIRRLHFAVDFPFPEIQARAEIFRRTMPKSTPLDDEVDLQSLARRYRLSGGNIRNVVVASAFLAAAEDSVVRQKHLELAVRREHQKMGKWLVSEEALA